MLPFVLYCKSYRQDVLRVRKLATSVQRFNAQQLPFYVSVPGADLALFREHLSELHVELIPDSEIVAANPSLDPGKLDALPGITSQQIVKSEFWRLNVSESYLCIDSDCEFVRPFGAEDFLTPDGYPYTIMHEAKELLQFALNHRLEKVYDYFHREHSQIMGIFERRGRAYEFGPPPLIWSRAVWQALDERFLKPRGMNFYDAVMMFPAEIQWYGEAMLKYLPYPLMPIEPLFKFYHYEPQYIEGQRLGESHERLAKNFLGVCYQSNWDKDRDLEQKKRSPASRAARWVRRNIFKRYK
jgi:hypothetical protein